MTQFNRDLT